MKTFEAGEHTQKNNIWYSDIFQHHAFDNWSGNITKENYKAFIESFLMLLGDKKRSHQAILVAEWWLSEKMNIKALGVIPDDEFVELCNKVAIHTARLSKLLFSKNQNK